jgi:hypothetical protein
MYVPETVGRDALHSGGKNIFRMEDLMEETAEKAETYFC